MIIVRIWEGLGNQMFQYAYARFLSRKGILGLHFGLRSAIIGKCVKSSPFPFGQKL